MTTLATETPAAIGQDVACFVDLDGTLVATDTLVESFLSLLRQQPWLIFCLPFWLWKGRAYLKDQIAQQTQLDPALLPYRTDVVEYLHETQRQQRQLHLATAANHRIAHAVADHLGVFDSVLASTASVNLKGQHKLTAIREIQQGKPFEYLGDSRSDFAIWSEADLVGVAAPTSSLQREVRERFPTARVFSEQPARWRYLLGLLRPHQFAKSLLLFVPILAAHQFTDVSKWITVALAFVSFCGCAAAGHILNDFLDLASDRAHPQKRRRPIASGRVTAIDALLTAAAALSASLLIAVLWLPNHFWLVGLGYLACSVAYSVSLKRILLLDVVLLAGFYAYRIWAGGMVIDVVLSPWLIALSIFFFLNLAFLKRYIDINAASAKGLLSGRAYQAEDAEIIRSLGPAAGYLSVLVLALYINSDAVKSLYAQPQVLWLICLCFVYWISRMWLLAHRGQVPADPVAFTVRDPISYGVAMATAVIYFLAI